MRKRYPDTIKSVNFNILEYGHEKSKIQFLSAELSNEWKLQDPEFATHHKKWVENKIEKEIIEPLLTFVK